MLDGRETILLNRINELCRDGHYKVVERSDLLCAFPSFIAQREEELDELLSCLADRKYIDIRYADRANGVYCLFPLPAGRSYLESTRSQELEKSRKILLFFLAAALGGLLGGAFGAGMVSLIMRIW